MLAIFIRLAVFYALRLKPKVTRDRPFFHIFFVLFRLTYNSIPCRKKPKPKIRWDCSARWTFQSRCGDGRISFICFFFFQLVLFFGEFFLLMMHIITRTICETSVSRQKRRTGIEVRFSILFAIHAQKKFHWIKYHWKFYLDYFFPFLAVFFWAIFSFDGILLCVPFDAFEWNRNSYLITFFCRWEISFQICKPQNRFQIKN